MIRKELFQLLFWINIVGLFVALFFTVWTIDFSAVKYYTLFGMVCLVGSLCYYNYRKTGNRGLLKIMTGICLALSTAFIFSFKWGVSPWFNHNDISHIIHIISVLIILQGMILILKDIPDQM